jgi:hypothetical protein
VGSDEEWANDAPGKSWWSCPVTLSGIVAGGLVTMFGLFVLIADGLRLL